MSVYPGADVSTFLSNSAGIVTGSDMDLSFTAISGPRVCLETILRKLMCPPGSMDDRAWGIDLRTYLCASLTAGQLAGLGAAVRAQVVAEEYVDDARVTCLQGADGRLVVDLAVELADEMSYTFAFALGPAGIQVILDVTG